MNNGFDQINQVSLTLVLIRDKERMVEKHHSLREEKRVQVD